MSQKIRIMDDLIYEATYGELTKDEIFYVVQRIKDTTPEDDKDLSTLIFILARAGTAEYKPLIEKYLYYPKNPRVSRETLKALCSYWNLTPNYLNEIKQFIKGVTWDDCDDVRIVALSISGEFLRTSFDKDLLQLLIHFFENLGYAEDLLETDEGDGREILKGGAYEALLRAIGKEWDEIPDVDAIETVIKNKKLVLTTIKKLVKCSKLNISP